jgi:DNA helicase-2/ATP-dependent DNA helicase PcrA
MELHFVCSKCKKKGTIDANELMALGKVLCKKCREEENLDNLIVHPETLTTTQDNSSSPTQPIPEKLTSNNPIDPTLNVEQARAACYDGNADGILLLAGAGCGKTKTLAARSCFLTQVKKVTPYNIALLTFTRKAAKEIKERINLYSQNAGNYMFIGTFHRFCLNLMHKYAHNFPFESKRLIDEDDKLKILRKIREDKIKGDEFAKEEIPVASKLSHIVSYTSNTLITLTEYFERYPNNDYSYERIEEVLNEYKKHKDEYNLMDFDDILSLTAQNLKENPEFAVKISHTYTHILVDEMQDTSPVQWSILESLYPSSKLFCVGDDAQSIYSFRGADFASVHNFCDKLPNSVILKLTENYRSNQEILDLSNLLLDASPLEYKKDLHAHKGPAGFGPTMKTCYDEQEEAKYICNAIKQELKAGTSPDEIMVLFRSLYNARELEITLRREHINYRLIGGQSFMQASHIKDIVGAFEALFNPPYELGLIRFLCLHPKIGEKTCEKLIAKLPPFNDHQEYIQNLIDILPDKLSGLKKFLSTLTITGDSHTLLSKLFDYFEKAKLIELNYENDTDRKKDLDYLLKSAQNTPAIKDFLESYKLDPNENIEEDNDPIITLITVHSAKGTEADVCFIIRAHNGSFPHTMASTIEEVEEERRILYVAMTRARKRLYLSRCTDMDSGFITFQMETILDKNNKLALKRKKR